MMLWGRNTVWWMCVLWSAIAHVVYCQPLYSIKFFMNMLMLRCVISCISRCASASLLLLEVLSSGWEVPSNREWLCFGVSLSPLYCIDNGIRPSGCTRWCDKRGTDAAAFSGLGSEFFFCSSHWLFCSVFSVVRMFPEQDVQWCLCLCLFSTQ